MEQNIPEWRRRQAGPQDPGGSGASSNLNGQTFDKRAARLRQAGEFMTQLTELQSTRNGGRQFWQLQRPSEPSASTNNIYNMSNWRSELPAVATPTPTPNSLVTAQAASQTRLRADAPPFVPHRFNLSPRTENNTHNTLRDRIAPAALPGKLDASASTSQETEFRSPDSGYDSDQDLWGQPAKQIDDEWSPFPFPIQPVASTSSQPLRRDNPPCSICLDPPDEFPIQLPTTQCTHALTVCAPCLEQHISHSVLTDGSTTVPCPEAGCGQTMEYDDVIRGAKNDKACLERYETLLLRRMLEHEPNFVWCKSATCGWGQVHESGADAPIVICQTCHTRSCFTHDVAWHTDLTCDQYDAQLAEREREAQANTASEQYIQLNAKICPNESCKRKIEKIDGCDHMVCRRPAGCGHEFCWNCLADYAPIRSEGNHHHKPDCRHYAAIESRTPWIRPPRETRIRVIPLAPPRVPPVVPPPAPVTPTRPTVRNRGILRSLSNIPAVPVVPTATATIPPTITTAPTTTAAPATVAAPSIIAAPTPTTAPSGSVIRDFSSFWLLTLAGLHSVNGENQPR